MARGPRWITEAEAQSESGTLSPWVTLTNDQILACPNAPWIEFVPNLDADKYLIPLLFIAIQDFTGGIYTNLQTGTNFVGVGYIDGESFLGINQNPLDVESLLADDSQRYQWLIDVKTGIYEPGMAGKSLGFTIGNFDGESNVDFTGGNAANSLMIRVLYLTV